MVRKVVGTIATTAVVAIALGILSWFAFSALTGATIITFRTGSMSPTMPQGAAAITVPIRATEVARGDVLTVQRIGEPLPVTHRVISVNKPGEIYAEAADARAAIPGTKAPSFNDPNLREIEMQGDDNAQPDHLPYLITDASRVIFSLPALGTTLMLLQSPLGMGILILAAGGCTVWAFWPRRHEAPEPRAPKHMALQQEEVSP